MKKKLKGMTLIECVVALAVMSIMAVMLVTGIVTSLNSQKSTQGTLRKISYEAPTAEAKNAAVQLRDSTGKLRWVDASMNEVFEDSNGNPPPGSSPMLGYVTVDEPELLDVVILNPGYSNDGVPLYSVVEDPTKPIYGDVPDTWTDAEKLPYLDHMEYNPDPLQWDISGVDIFMGTTETTPGKFENPDGSYLIKSSGPDANMIISVQRYAADGTFIDTIEVDEPTGGIVNKYTLPVYNQVEIGYDVKYEDIADSLKVDVDVYRALDPNGNPDGFVYYIPKD